MERPVVGITGLGTMGCGIAVAALAHGMGVRLLDADAAATRAGWERVSRRLRGHVAAGLLGAPALQALDGIELAAGCADLVAGADLVVEAVPESWEVKREVLARLSAASGALLATNTSAFPVDQLATSVRDPTRFLGVHFFNPAEWVPGVEVVVGAQTSPGARDTALALLARMAKQPTVVSSSPGFLANRLQLALFTECLRCVDEGLATPAEVDRVVATTIGFRLPAFGPFAVADMAGLDVYGSILSTLAEAFGDRFAVPASLRALIDDGRFGVKTGSGYRSYSPREAEALMTRRDAAYARLAAATSVPPDPDPDPDRAPHPDPGRGLAPVATAADGAS